MAVYSAKTKISLSMFSDQFCDGREVSAVAYDSFVTEKVLPKDSDVDNIQKYSFLSCYH